jgi:WD40 repeat protein
MRTILATLLLAALAAAQSTDSSPGMDAPKLGYIFDANGKSIRLLTGVPGAAALDQAIPFAESIDFAFVFSTGQVAIARSKDGSILALRWNDTPSAVRLGGAPADLSGAAFSPSGEFVALFGKSGVVQLWSSLSGTPAMNRQWTLDSAQGMPLAAAVNDDMAVVAATDARTLLLLSDEARVLLSGLFTGLAFSPGTGDLIAADADSGRVLDIHNWSDDVSIREIAGSADTLAPGILAIGADRNTVALANTGAAEIDLINLTSGAVQRVACQCRPQQFEALQGAAFHIVDSAQDSDLLLDGQNARISRLYGSAGVQQ